MLVLWLVGLKLFCQMTYTVANCLKLCTYNRRDVCRVLWRHTGRWVQLGRGTAKQPGLSRRTSRLVAPPVLMWLVPTPMSLFENVLRNSLQPQTVWRRHRLLCPISSILEWDAPFKWFTLNYKYGNDDTYFLAPPPTILLYIYIYCNTLCLCL